MCSKYIYSSLYFLWTQTRPAIEFGSGEEGLRPLRVCLRGRPDYAKAPGSYCGAEGRCRDGLLSDPVPLVSRVLSFSLPCVLHCSQKMSSMICPVGQRLWRPELHKSSFVRGTQPGWSGSLPSMRRLLRCLSPLRVATPWSILRSTSYALASGTCCTCNRWDIVASEFDFLVSSTGKKNVVTLARGSCARAFVSRLYPILHFFPYVVSVGPSWRCPSLCGLVHRHVGKRWRWNKITPISLASVRFHS